MSIEMTRKELYELVWSKPRSEIAKELAVSDVRLGKLCRDMNVPAPPRGYWANLTSRRRTRKFIKPPLRYNLGERIEEDHAVVWASLQKFDAKNLTKPLPPPPVFEDSLAEAVGRYMELLGQTPMPKATRSIHPITQKFIAEDERLASLSRKYSWYQPKYRTTEGEDLLQGLNQVLWMWTDLGFKPSSGGHRNITMWVGRGGYRQLFEIISTELDSSRAVRRRPREIERFEFWLDVQPCDRP